MSLYRIAFGTLAELLKSQKKKRLATVSEAQLVVLNAIRNFESTIKADLPGAYGAVLHDTLHESKSERIPHYTVDVYNKDDKPIGTLHVFESDTTEPKVLKNPRAKAEQAWKDAQEIV